MSEAIIVTIITAVVGPTIVLMVRSNRRIASKIGEPNGHGSLVAMVQSVLSGQASQDDRLAQVESRMARQEGQVQSLHSRLADVEKALVSEIKQAATQEAIL